MSQRSQRELEFQICGAPWRFALLKTKGNGDFQNASFVHVPFANEGLHLPLGIIIAALDPT